jgi:hypothetical protein
MAQHQKGPEMKPLLALSLMVTVMSGPGMAAPRRL